MKSQKKMKSQKNEITKKMKSISELKKCQGQIMSGSRYFQGQNNVRI